MEEENKNKKKNKRKRIKFLREKYLGRGESSIREDVFNELKEADPTEKKKYLHWLLNLYDGNNLLEEDLKKANEYLSAFDRYKYQLDDKDINNYKDLVQLFKVVSPYLNEDQISNSELIKKKKEEGIRLVDENKRWKIIVPLNQEASNLYGKGTQWCTTSSKGSTNEFFKFSKQGPLYIIINKNVDRGEKKYHKYQFHFESHQFMDATNERVDIEDFFYQNPDLLNIFAKEKTQFGIFVKFNWNLFSDDQEYEVIEGDFNSQIFSFSNIKNKISKKLHIKGNAYINNIEEIEGLKVDGNLDLRESNLKRINEILEVGKSIYAKNSYIEQIPDNTKIGKVAEFSFSNLEKLPHNMSVGDHCHLTDTNIKNIRKKHNLKVGGNLYAHDLGINKDDIEAEVERKIFCEPQVPELI